MTRAEIEKELDQWNVMVHGNKEFTPNCLCKFTWETPQRVDLSELEEFWYDDQELIELDELCYI